MGYDKGNYEGDSPFGGRGAIESRSKGRVTHETDLFRRGKAVTGSCHCVEVRGKKILIDCGLQQGRDERDNAVFDFSPNYIDYVIVTHAHIDHSGRIPLLIKEGFQGQIFTTRLTGQLLSVMLQDSAHIQEQDAQWKNQKGKRAGRPPVEPLYTVADAARWPSIWSPRSMDRS